MATLVPRSRPLRAVMVGVIVATTTVVLAPSRRVRPCDCGPADLALIFPDHDAGDVPRDTLIWLDNPTGIATIDAHLTWIGGNAALTPLELGLGARLTVLEPDRQLPADTRITLTAAVDGRPGTLSHEFRTGSADDGTTALSPPSMVDSALVSEGGGCGSSCGEAEHYKVRLASSTPAIVLAITERSADAGGALRDVTVLDAATSTATSDAVLRLGSFICEPSTFDVASGDTRMRFGAVSPSGATFSGWSQPRDVDPGCSGGATADLGLMVAAGVLVLVRRRARAIIRS